MVQKYDAAVEDDLPFKAGDEVILIQQVDDQWFRGFAHGRMGLFPSNFVEVLTSLEDGKR